MTDVREIERRIEQSAERVDSHVTLPGRPAGIPEDVEEHIKLMYDLLALAWQTEITRTSTFMLAKELSNAVYPKSGIRDSFHILSHHSNNENSKARFAVLNRYHADAVRLLPRQALEASGRRGHTAGSLAHPVRQRHERRQLPQP